MAPAGAHLHDRGAGQAVMPPAPRIAASPSGQNQRCRAERRSDERTQKRRPHTEPQHGIGIVAERIVPQDVLKEAQVAIGGTTRTERADDRPSQQDQNATENSRDQVSNDRLRERRDLTRIVTAADCNARDPLPECAALQRDSARLRNQQERAGDCRGKQGNPYLVPQKEEIVFRKRGKQRRSQSNIEDQALHTSIDEPRNQSAPQSGNELLRCRLLAVACLRAQLRDIHDPAPLPEVLPKLGTGFIGKPAPLSVAPGPLTAARR